MPIQPSLPELPKRFRPLPLFGNGHVQTLLGNLLPGTKPILAAVEHLVVLPDGDRLVLHDSTPPGWRTGDPIALLVHGLGGTHASGYMGRTAVLLLGRGYFNRWRSLLTVSENTHGQKAGDQPARREEHSCSSGPLVDRVVPG